MEKPVLAVIGLGNIGGGVARNLARAGYTVKAYDHDPTRYESVLEAGAAPASSAAEAVSGVDVVFTSLPGPQQILSVAPDIVGNSQAGTIWVELSTNNLETARQLLASCSDAGVELIDAPVSGGPEGAEAGTLSIFVGGADNAVARVMPLLGVIGTKVDHLGPNGTGIVAKIAQVTLCYTQTVTLVEALLLGVKGGIEPTKMLDLIQHSAGRSYVSDNYGPEILAGTYDPTFPIGHAAKDMRLADELASAIGVDLAFMKGVGELYAQAESEFGSAAPHLMAAQLIERRNGIVLHKESRPINDTAFGSDS